VAKTGRIKYKQLGGNIGEEQANSWANAKVRITACKQSSIHKNREMHKTI
jgi:hypothetical protein